MFSIDLLKGRGLPRKRNPKKKILQAVLLIIPVIAVVSLAASYQQGTSLLRSQEAKIKHNQQEIAQCDKAMKEFSKINQQITKNNNVLNEIGRAMSYRIQVTDFLLELIESLPDEIFIYEMDMERHPLKEKIKNPKTGDVVENLIVSRVLTLVLCGYESIEGNQIVQDYIETLKDSQTLAVFFDDFRLAARRQGQINDKSTTYYEIECIFHEQR